MASTPGYSGLLNAAFPRIGQYEASTGRRIRGQVVQGLLQADLDKAKQFAMAEDFRNRQLALQQQQLDIQRGQIAKQDKAGLISGIGQLTQLPLAYMATKNLLGLNRAPAAATSPALLGTSGQAAVAPAVADVAAQVPVLQAPGALSAGGGYTAPLLQTPTTFATGEVGAGLGTTAAAVPSAGSALLGAAGPIAALAGAQYLSGKALQPTLDKAGFSTAGKGWTYGGLPGAMLGGSIDVGKKIFEGAKDFFSKIF